MKFNPTTLHIKGTNLEQSCREIKMASPAFWGVGTFTLWAVFMLIITS